MPAITANLQFRSALAVRIVDVEFALPEPDLFAAGCNDRVENRLRSCLGEEYHDYFAWLGMRERIGVHDSLHLPGRAEEHVDFHVHVARQGSFEGRTDIIFFTCGTEEHIAALDEGADVLQAQVGAELREVFHGDSSRGAEIDGAEEGDEDGVRRYAASWPHQFTRFQALGND